MSEKSQFVHVDILEIFHIIDFNCTSFAGISIFIKNHYKVMEAILGQTIGAELSLYMYIGWIYIYCTSFVYMD